METPQTTTTQIPRHHIVSFRLTGEEAARIDLARDRLGSDRTRADWCRALALKVAGAKVPEPVKPLRSPARRTPSYDRRLLSAVLGHLGSIATSLDAIQDKPSMDDATRDGLRKAYADIRWMKDTVSKVLADED